MNAGAADVINDAAHAMQFSTNQERGTKTREGASLVHPACPAFVALRAQGGRCHETARHSDATTTKDGARTNDTMRRALGGNWPLICGSVLGIQ